MDKLFSLFKQIEKNSDSGKPISKIIIGLGNPGDKYTYTRHNTGFLALSYISQKLNISINRSKFKSLSSECIFGTERTLFLMPQTYMNNSGEAVKSALDFYKLSNTDILVIFDDTTLDCGRIRIRKNGSAGGHNGIKSIIEHIGTNEFARIKVGVGQKPHPEMDLADHVLSVFSKEEQKILFEKFENVYKASELIISGQTDKAMNLYNS